MYKLKPMRTLFIITLLSFLTLSVQGQTAKKPVKGDPEKAMELYRTGNFYGAIPELEKLVKGDPNNLTYRALLGYAYLNTNIDKTKAIEHFEIVIKDDKADVYSYYDLGRAYMLAYRFDEALKSFQTFQSKNKEKEKDLIVSTARMIEMCNYAKEAYKNRSNVTLENLSDVINSEFPDYYPFIDEYETTLFFSSKRKGNVGSYVDIDGLLTSDVFISNVAGDSWQKPKRLSSIVNTYLIEESVGMSADGNELLIYIYNENGMDDIFISSKKGKNYQKAEFLTFNTKFEETSATISPDKKYIIFSSKMEGGSGGKDLYISKKLPNDTWSEAKSLGPSINTKYDEEFASFSPDGRTIYFASQGHKSMGGFDLFKTTWDPSNMSFTEPINLGYPINTPDDNKTISFTKSGRYAYIADLRPGGKGNLDIFKVIFKDVVAPYIVYAGHIINKDSVDIFEAQRLVVEKIKAKISNLESSLEKEKANLDSYKFKLDEIAKDTGTLAQQKRSSYERSISNTQIKIDNLINNDIPEAKNELKEAEKDMNVKIKLLNIANKQVISTFIPLKTTGEFAVIAQPGNYILSVTSEKYGKWEADFIIPEREPQTDPYLYNIYIEKPAPKLFK